MQRITSELRRVSVNRWLWPAFALAGSMAGCQESLDAPLARIPLARKDGSRLATPGGAAAVVNGQPVTLAALAPLLLEAAGGTALTEYALDVMVRDELARRGLRVTPGDVEAERRLFTLTLADAGESTAQAEIIAESVRSRRGLGPAREASLTRRSAGLRKLISGTVSVSEAELDLAERIRTGPRHEVRVIVTPDAPSASAARSEAIGGEQAFAETARRRSVDPSAPQGGFIGAISLDDPAYPSAVRGALRGRPPGHVTSVIPLDEGFVIARLERVVPPTNDSINRDELRAELIRRKERVAMETLASDLLRRADVSVLDPSLAWAWESRNRRTPEGR